MTTKELSPMVRRMTGSIDELNAGMDDFMQRQARGDKSDGAEFLALIQKRTVAQMALQAHAKLDEKPIKTVLNETR